MECPKCKSKTLVMSERQGVEIDYCPSCRGVWLDRGELDKILERSELSSQQGADTRYQEPVQRHTEGRYEHKESADKRYHSTPHYQDKRYGYKKKSWLSDILDFD